MLVMINFYNISVKDSYIWKSRNKAFYIGIYYISIAFGAIVFMISQKPIYLFSN